jgi:hypothetical protein
VSLIYTYLIVLKKKRTFSTCSKCRFRVPYIVYGFCMHHYNLWVKLVKFDCTSFEMSFICNSKSIKFSRNGLISRTPTHLSQVRAWATTRGKIPKQYGNNHMLDPWIKEKNNRSCLQVRNPTLPGAHVWPSLSIGRTNVSWWWRWFPASSLIMAGLHSTISP